jgi:poly-gamma-glutamate synthesis protein (capsule biosynthesis protein)
VTKGIEIFVAGDALMQYPFAAYANERVRAVRSLIDNADVGIVNLECCIQENDDWPAYVGGGGRFASYVAAPPACVRDLRAIGIDAVFGSNNHCMDFGENGVLTTLRHLDAVGLAHAGIGANRPLRRGRVRGDSCRTGGSGQRGRLGSTRSRRPVLSVAGRCSRG